MADEGCYDIQLYFFAIYASGALDLIVPPYCLKIMVPCQNILF